MSDPLGLIGNLGAATRAIASPQRDGQGGAVSDGPSFKDMLQQQIDQVNQLQNDASSAMEDLAAGRRDDVASVMLATQKADIAFKMLLQVRNKVMDAYEEVKQMRI